jgi:hypothetical protein
MGKAGPETIPGGNTAGSQVFIAANGGVSCRAGAPDLIAVPIAPPKNTGGQIDQTVRAGNHALS